MEEKKELVLRIDSTVALPDKNQWINRFEIRSETSDRIYVISQHKTLRHWGCSCPAWITRRRCKHLGEIGLPLDEKPFEPKILKE